MNGLFICSPSTARVVFLDRLHGGHIPWCSHTIGRFNMRKELTCQRRETFLFGDTDMVTLTSCENYLYRCKSWMKRCWLSRMAGQRWRDPRLFFTKLNIELFCVWFHFFFCNTYHWHLFSSSKRTTFYVVCSTKSNQYRC